MFKLLGPYLHGGTALDLYAGTGALGLEAVSRGYTDAVLVDRQYAAIKTLHTNVAHTKQAERFTVLLMSDTLAISTFAANHQQLQLIYMDPPYAQQTVLAQLAAFVSQQLVVPGGRVLVTTGLDVHYPQVLPGYTKIRRQTYGVAQVLILEHYETHTH